VYVYDDLIENGATEEEADILSTVGAVGISILEKFGLEKIFGNKASIFVKNFENGLLRFGAKALEISLTE
jgi:hypothetical protein